MGETEPIEPMPTQAAGAPRLTERSLDHGGTAASGFSRHTGVRADAGFPSEAVAIALRPTLDVVSGQVARAIKDALPFLRDVRHETYRVGFVRGIPRALELFVDEIAAGEPRSASSMFERFGQGHAQCGRGLDELLSSYRVGARVAWRHFRATAASAGHTSENVALIAEAGFDFIDRISAASARGFEGSGSPESDGRSLLTGVDAELSARLRAALGSIAGRWTLEIMVALFEHDRRYNGLLRAIPGVSSRMLTRTLRTLERERLVRRECPGGGQAVVYALTPDGAKLVGALRPLELWAAARPVSQVDSPDGQSQVAEVSIM